MKIRFFKILSFNLLIFCSILFLTGCRQVEVITRVILDATSYVRLAERWAPVHYQDVDQSGGDALRGRSDYITAVDFDGDWNTQNNWENSEITSNAMEAYCYYSVVQTETHWFIIYAFYHPRDWTDLPDFRLDTHENDMEGLLAIVKRPAQSTPNDYGELLGIITVFHLDFFSYTASDSPLASGQEDIDGTLQMENVPGQLNPGMLHPVTAQEAKGHGLKAYPQVQIEGGDGLKYFPSTEVAEEPSHPNDRFVKYKLVYIFDSGGLWAHVNDSQTFTSGGKFKGDNGVDNSANPPWKWDDHDDGSELIGGELAVDPVKLVRIYFSNLGNFSEDYEFNLYKGIH